MLRVLLAKDLRRAWRNPLPWLINLIVPLALTALIGLTFGGNSGNGALGRIRFAVVDEDQSRLGKFLRGAANQQQDNQYLDPVFMERAEAMREINASHVSAVLIIPANFTSHYLLATVPVSLELTKNPAESVHPAVLEESLGAVVTALNGISHNFNSEFPEVRALGSGPVTLSKISSLIEHVRDKFTAAPAYLDPPLVGYETEETTTGPGTTAGSPSQGIFAYLLAGLSAMFLLFIASSSMADLQRELSMRTFARYQTLRQSAGPFVTGKIVFTTLLVLACAGIMLGGGGLIFRVRWEHPFALAALTVGYAGFIAALYAVVAALIPDERRAAVFSNLIGMALGLIGGCTFPPENLPAFMRDHITPLMPSYWYADAARNLQYSATAPAWGGVALQLLIAGMVMAVLAAILFRRRLNSGLRA